MIELTCLMMARRALVGAGSERKWRGKEGLAA